MNELISSSQLEAKENDIILEKKYHGWVIDSWNELKNPEFSELFTIGGYQWYSIIQK